MTKIDLFQIFKKFLNVWVFQFTGMIFQLLAIPLITRKYGLEIFGEIALTTSVAYLLGNIINYGTNQTEVKNISVQREKNHQLSELFSNTFWLRLLVFLVIASFYIFSVILLKYDQLFLWLSITPFLLAEIFNPLYFFIGIEKIHWISWGSVIVRLLSFLLILFVSLKSNESIVLNLFLSAPLLFFYLFYTMFLIRRFKLRIGLPHFENLRSKLINNFQVTFNGNVGILQQSIFLFLVAKNFNAVILGSYGIVDKLLNAIRQIISAFSTAIYPMAAELFHKSKSSWLVFRFEIQKIYFFASLSLGVLLFIFANQIFYLISFEQNSLAANFIRLMSPAPLFFSLNANNILDFLLNEHYKGMFNVSIFILMFTVIISYTLSSTIFHLDIGWYPLLIESACFLIYAYAIKKYRLHES